MTGLSEQTDSLEWIRFSIDTSEDCPNKPIYWNESEFSNATYEKEERGPSNKKKKTRLLQCYMRIIFNYKY